MGSLALSLRRYAPIVEWGLQGLILYSIVTYFVELEIVKSEHSLAGHPFFIWSERVVAAIFTIEYGIRWRLSKSWKYPLTLPAIIDLLAILPFYIGFLIDLRALRMIRTLRVLRLLKFYRYHEALQRIIKSFKRATPNLVAVGFIVSVFVLFSATFMYESEYGQESQRFDSIFDAIWWSVVTMTTVGYGDLYPETTAGRLVGIITIVFGVSIFSMLFSVLQEAFAGDKDDNVVTTQERFDRLEALILELQKGPPEAPDPHYVTVWTSPPKVADSAVAEPQ